MSDRGFISISRKIFENPILVDPVYFRAWVWFLAEAAWKPTRERVVSGRTAASVTLERGQFTHSRRFIADALGMSEQRIRTTIKLFKINGMIDHQSNHGQMLITIIKYDDYQQPATSKTTHEPTSEQPTNQPKLNNTNKEIKEERAAPKAKKTKRAGCTLPDGFVMDDGMRQYAASLGFTGTGVERMFQKFCNNATAKGLEYIDWRAAWRTWVDNQARWDAERSAPLLRRVPDV